VASLLLGLAACGGGDPQSLDGLEAADAVAPAFEPKTILDAVLVGDKGAVERFLAQGADVNASELDGTTLLMRAIHGQFPDIARLLVAKGANVSARNRYGVSALYLAARSMDAVSTRALLAAGADPNTSLPEGETVLMTAAKAGDVNVVRALLAGGSRAALAIPGGADPFAVQGGGYGATAIAQGRDDGADPDAKDGWYGQTALMWAAREGHADVMRLLIAAGANVNERSKIVDAPESYVEDGFVYPKIPKGRLTALHFAAREGRLEAAQVLIDAGADVNAVDADGASPLLFAGQNGHDAVARALLAAGAEPVGATPGG
jgi:ankyrin repeat protein